MNATSSSHKEEIRLLKTIHFAMIFGQIVFAGVAFYIVYSGIMQPTDPAIGSVFVFLVPVLVISAWVASRMLFGYRVGIAKQQTGLVEKLSAYRSALIIRFALLEGSALIAIIATLVTGNLLHLAIAGLIILYFLTLAPTAERVAEALELSPEDQVKLKGQQ